MWLFIELNCSLVRSCWFLVRPGVGVTAVQIGKVCDATVIAIARGEEKLQYLKSLSCCKFEQRESVKGFLKARKLKGVDVLYDPVGGKLPKETMKLLNWGAKILVNGFASEEVPVIPTNIALVKDWTVHGSTGEAIECIDRTFLKIH